MASFWRITIATLLVVFVLYKFFDSIGPDRRIQDDEMSGIRLHHVDDAVCLYAGEHDGRLPDNLKDAVAGAGFEPKDTQCPRTRMHGAKLQNPPEFMYLGAGLRIKDMADEQIIACEPFSESTAKKNETIVVLRADNHVESIPIPEVEKRIHDAANRASKSAKTAASRPKRPVKSPIPSVDDEPMPRLFVQRSTGTTHGTDRRAILEKPLDA